LFREFVAHKARSKRQHEETIFLAWKTADLTRCKTLPDLQKLLNRAPSGPQKQSIREMRDNLEAIGKLIGTPLQKAKGKRGKR
jgi:hypothetical protein